jgi:hypothetical protein
MKIKLRIAIAAAALLLLTAGLTALMLNNAGRKPDNPGVKAGLLSDAQLLEKYMSDKSKKGEQGLVSLASKQDAVGYFANLALAERYSQRGADPVPFYRKARELYDSKDVRKEMAKSLAKQGSFDEAASLYASALPDEDAKRSLFNLEMSPDVAGKALLESGQWDTAADYLKDKVSGLQETAERNRNGH